MTDAAGLSLYLFDKDTANMSACPDIVGCTDTWPAFTDIVADEDFGTAGEYTTYYIHPLYYFANDEKAGDILGDGVNGVWHLIYPNTDFTETDEVKLSNDQRRQYFLTDDAGMALYTFDNDEINVSNCYGTCEEIWPVLEGSVEGTLPMGVAAADFGTTTRTDGTVQTTYKGMPLYYFANDAVAGDTNGDWVNGVWHLIELKSEPIIPEPVPVSAGSRDVQFMVDAEGMSLYTFDKDDVNVSNCPNVAGCTDLWPPFTATVESIEFGSTGTYTTYYKHPLYYFINDMNPGDVLGDNYGKVWHLVYPHTSFVDSAEVKRSETVRRQTYLTDKDGRALYTFDVDDVNVSNCYGMCEDIWPIYDVAGISEAPEGIDPADFTIIERDGTKSEHTKQVAYKGMPLYYFVSDTEAGDNKGDWVNGVWHLIELNATTVEPVAEIGDAAAGEARFQGACSTCHGTDGRQKPNDFDNIIAEYDDPADIRFRLTDMRDNPASMKSAIMRGIAANLSDEEINNLSAYIATLP